MKIVIILLSLLPSLLFALDYQRRLGVGMSNQLGNDLPALSMKVQKSRSFAVGGLFSFSSDDTEGGYGAGVKFYKILFDEPQLNFYAAGLGAIIKEKTGTTDKSGYQGDFTLGSEFHFQGLNSLGFSFEFGASLRKIDSMVIQTTGAHIVTAALHFYL